MTVSRLAGGALAVLATLALVAPADAQMPKPLSPQPEANGLADGLAVRYYESRFELIAELEDFMKSSDGEEGEPIAELNYQVGEGKVLTSNYRNFVGAHITGAMNLELPGTYAFEVTSNDGIRIVLGGAEIYANPGVHPDWTSDPIPVEIAEPGWYPVEVLYFEKKSSSTIVLKWMPPGEKSFVVVPARALKHVAN